MTISIAGVNARRDFPTSAEIAATGYCYGGELVDNDTYLSRCRFSITDDRAALERETKMKTRTWCGPDENPLTMARRAVAMALSRDPTLRDEIDVILVTSATTIPVFYPAEKEHAGMADLAPLILKDIGRSGVMAFDLKAVNCTGFLRGLQVMDGLLVNANYRAGLVISTEQCSIFSLGENNRSTFNFISSDAAGAAVIRRRPRAPRTGIVDHVGFTDADRFHLMTIQPDLRSLYVGGSRLGEAVLGMLIACGRALLDRNGLSINDVDWLLPIQTHASIIEGMRASLGWPAEKLLWRGDVTGFAGSASIPAALADHMERGVIKRGDLVLSLAVAAGMNCAGALYHA